MDREQLYERINKFYDLSSQIPAVYIAEAITSLMEKQSKL